MVAGNGVIEGMLFDLDGTLCNTHEANFESYSRALADFGISLDRPAFDAMIGLPASVFVPRFAPMLTETEVSRVLAVKAEYFTDALTLIQPNRPLIAFLRSIRAHHTTALVTTSRRVNATRVLGHIGISDQFDHLVFAEDVTKAKPDPEAYLLALDLCRLDPAKTIAFEDSPTGVAAAEAAGVRVVCVRCED